MIDLAKHIEVLLLESDCVIVPDLGGFIAHYIPAKHVEDENIFLPPTRVIGFNPQLKINDGLLVQSYMSVYGTNFVDAAKMVDCKVKELISTLHEEGEVNLPNVGELHFTIYNTYDFIPYDNKITTPYLYGLDVFEMHELAAFEKRESVIAAPSSLATSSANEKKHSTRIKLNPAYLTSAAAVIVAFVLSFFFSSSVENTQVMDENYARLLPEELFEKIEKQSLAITPIIVKHKPAFLCNAKRTTAITYKPDIKHIAIDRSKIATKTSSAQLSNMQPKAIAKPYHMIVASVVTESDAEIMALQLVAKGFAEAKAIIGDGKMRVCINSYKTEAEAYKALIDMRQNEKYQNAWILKK